MSDEIDTAIREGRLLAATVVPVSRATLERLAALLEQVEWNGGDRDGDAMCPDPDCSRYPIERHTPDCELAALRTALAELLK